MCTYIGLDQIGVSLQSTQAVIPFVFLFAGMYQLDII